MKKFMFMLALGSVLFGLSACSSDDENIEGESTEGCVFIKLENVVGPSSRMTEDPKIESDITDVPQRFHHLRNTQVGYPQAL